MKDGEEGNVSGPDSPGSRWWQSTRLWIFVGVPLVLLSGFGGLYEYSTSPSFCRSCHIMEPYYQAWATSTHNNVPCVSCHYPPGQRDALRVKFQALSQVAKFVTRTYSSKPFAEVEDASCLRANCHATRLLEGELKYKGFVRFNHREHLSERRAGKKLRCTSCHSQIVVGSHMVVTAETCFLCHFKKGVRESRQLEPLAGCDKCHTPPNRSIRIGDITYNHRDFARTRNVACQSCHLDTIQGEGEAPRERCFDCHNKPEHLSRYKDIAWIHDQHVTGKNIECSRCHKPIQHKIVKVSATMPRQVECQACHKDEHDIQQLMFLGTGGVGVPDLPSPMFLARVDCTACHIKPRAFGASATIFQASEEACLKCHPSNYRGMIKEWKTTIKKALKEFAPKVRAAEEALKKAGDNPNRFYARELMGDVRQNVKIVRTGNPIHNIYYAARLLQASNDRLNEMAKALSVTLPRLNEHSLISGTFCSTLCHNRVGAKVPERVTWNGIRVPHRQHWDVMKIGCATCHAFGHHKEVSVKIPRENCLACHHKILKAMPQVPCEGCHRRQAAFRKGQSLGETAPTKAPMTALPCQMCHSEVVKKGHSEADVRASCKKCHNPMYERVLDTWKGQVSKGLESLEGGVKKATARLAGVHPDVVKQVNEKLAEVRRLTETIAFDQSGGIHNVPYATGLIQRAEKELKEAGDALGLSASAGPGKAGPAAR